MPPHRPPPRDYRIPRGQGVFRAREATDWGISRAELRRLTEAGVLEHVARGLYLPAGARVTEHHSLAEAAQRVPAGVVCLLSALTSTG